MRLQTDPTVKDAALVAARREQIAETALHFFMTRGYHATTVREIAQAVGLSVGSLFNYFRSKEQILHFIYDQAHTPIEAEVEEVLRELAGDPETALRVALDRYLGLIDRFQDHVVLVYQEFKSLDSRAKRLVLDRERRIMGVFAQIVEAGVRHGRFKPQALAVVANTIMALGHLWALRRWAFKPAITLEEFKRVQIDMILAGLRPDGTSAQEGSRPWEAS